MNDYPIPDKEQLDELRVQFAQVSASSELIEGAQAGGGEGVSPAQLFAYATGATPYPDPGLENKLRNSPGMRAAYKRMLASNALYDFGMPMAASDGELLPRKGEDCSIRFEKSQADQGLYYVIIEMKSERDRQPGYLVVCDNDQNCHQFPVPNARRGIIQFLVEEDAELLNLLRDPNTEVLLR